jgi:hypothetical protein
LVECMDFGDGYGVFVWLHRLPTLCLVGLKGAWMGCCVCCLFLEVVLEDEACSLSPALAKVLHRQLGKRSGEFKVKKRNTSPRFGYIYRM